MLANVPKTVVMALLDYLQEQTGYEGIALVLAKPAGPELAPNQEGEEELMPFPVLDACFHLFAGEKLLPEEVAEALVVMFPELHAATSSGPGSRSSRASSSARSTSGCRRRSRCTSATSTSTASARCSSRWCRTRNGRQSPSRSSRSHPGADSTVPNRTLIPVVILHQVTGHKKLENPPRSGSLVATHGIAVRPTCSGEHQTMPRSSEPTYTSLAA